MNESKRIIGINRPGTIEGGKKKKSFSTTNALLIGILVGIIFYSLLKNTWGMLTLIPLYFIYKIINDPKNKRSKDSIKLLKERNLR